MSLIKENTSPPFLKDGGEMGKLTREFDWSSTSLGEPEQWPQSLKTVVSLLLNSKFPMFLWWGKDLIQFYNDAYRPSLGQDAKHPRALGQKGEDCWPEIWPIIQPLIDQVLSGGGATWSEDQLIPIYRNGMIEDVYWTFSYSPVPDDRGKIGGVLVICNETTGKVRNFEALKESEAQFRFAIEATELGTWDYDPFTNKFSGNARLKKWFGIDADSEIDLSIAINVVVEKDRERVTEAIRKALEYSSGGGYDVEYTIVHPVTKEERIVRAKGRAWFNEEKIAYRFNGTLQDVTDQVLSRKKLERAEERARLAIQSADLGTYEIDLLTDEMVTSERFNEIWGLDRTVSRADFAGMIHPDDRAMRAKAHEESIASGKLHYEARIINKDQEIRWVSVDGTVLYDINGKAHYLLGVIQDISAQKEKDRHKDSFIAMVSHELKTPLTSIFGYSQLMEARASLTSHPELAMIAMKVNELVKRLNYIVQDLVDVSRMEGDKLRFRENHFDISELVLQMIEETKTLSHHHDVQIGKIEPVRVFADKERISQVILNIIGNAIKYSNPQTVVIISVYRQDDRVTCSVKDSGIGISREDHSSIFERFYQASSTNRPAGLGLGLFIASEIIKRQKGKIWFESEPGKGSTFYFSLPVSE